MKIIDKRTEYKEMIDNMDGETMSFVLNCIFNRRKVLVIPSYECGVVGRLITSTYNQGIAIFVSMDRCDKCCDTTSH